MDWNKGEEEAVRDQRSSGMFTAMEETVDL